MVKKDKELKVMGDDLEAAMAREADLRQTNKRLTKMSYRL
jgi:hypothetical protein